MQLSRALLFLKVAELKEIAKDLALSLQGKKIELIRRILHFLKTGEKATTPRFPKISCGKPEKIRILKPDAVMLKGVYKNDLQTRLFFKTLIGDHFHFTAYGIDWLNEQWMQGTPPTYQAFAEMWQEIYERQKTDPLPAKEEWAYINFIKQFLTHYPHADRDTVMHAWHNERLRNVTWVTEFFSKLTF